MGGDKVFRQIVTIEDAIARGNNLIDLDEIRDENSDETYNNLWTSNIKLLEEIICVKNAIKSIDDFKKAAEKQKKIYEEMEKAIKSLCQLNE